VADMMMTGVAGTGNDVMTVVEVAGLSAAEHLKSVLEIGIVVNAASTIMRAETSASSARQPRGAAEEGGLVHALVHVLAPGLPRSGSTSLVAHLPGGTEEPTRTTEETTGTVTVASVTLPRGLSVYNVKLLAVMAGETKVVTVEVAGIITYEMVTGAAQNVTLTILLPEMFVTDVMSRNAQSRHNFVLLNIYIRAGIRRITCVIDYFSNWNYYKGNQIFWTSDSPLFIQILVNVTEI